MSIRPKDLRPAFRQPFKSGERLAATEMSTFRLTSLLTPWYPGSTLPGNSGWYRARTERLTGGRWSFMAYFDGSVWWQYKKLPWHRASNARSIVEILQWQGLKAPARETAVLIRRHLPDTRGPRNEWLGLVAILELSFTAPSK